MSRFHRGGLAFQKPENALKRAEELVQVCRPFHSSRSLASREKQMLPGPITPLVVQVGQKGSALQTLHDVITSKRCALRCYCVRAGRTFARLIHNNFLWQASHLAEGAGADPVPLHRPVRRPEEGSVCQGWLDPLPQCLPAGTSSMYYSCVAVNTSTTGQHACIPSSVSPNICFLQG